MAYKDPSQEKAYQALYRAAHPEERAMYQRIYRAAHREKRKATHAADYLCHRTEELAKKKAYHQTHREEKKAYDASYRLAHPTERKALIDAWRAAHPEESAAIQQRRRARKINAPRNDLTIAQWKIILNAFGHCCAYCGTKDCRLTQDHIQPLSQGGSHTLSNIVPACKNCNSRKYTGPPLCPVQPVML